MHDSLLVILAAVETVDPGKSEIFPFGHFGLDWKLILAQAINFILVASIIWYFGLKRIIVTMDERQKKIADGLQFAEEAKRELSSAEKEKAEITRQANAQAQDILREAKERAEANSQKIKEQAERDIAERRTRAEESIEQERIKVLREARQDIARLVVLTSAKVLSTELSEADKGRFNEAAAREVAALN